MSTPEGTRPRAYRTDKQFLGLQIAILLIILFSSLALRDATLTNRQNGLTNRTVNCTDIAVHDAALARAMPQCAGHIAPEFYQLHPCAQPSCATPLPARPSATSTR